MNGGISHGLQVVSSFTHLMEGINQLLNSQAASSLSVDVARPFCHRYTG